MSGGRVAAATDSVKPPDYSDAGNADVFSHVYRDDLIYTDALGWLWWNGKRWERDDHKATAWALELSEKMLQEAKEENRAALLQVAEATAKHEETGAAEDADALEKVKADAARAKAYLTHAKNSRNAVRIKNMLELSKPGLVIKADKLDANPFDLNTPAGIVDLTSGGSVPTSGRPIAVRSRRPGQMIEERRCGVTSLTPSLAGTGVSGAFSSLWPVCR